MAKNAKSPLDEVEIIRQRDGVVDATPPRPLDARARRALADSRLRALALALNSEQPPRGANDPDDTELLAYLLEMLPHERRYEIEMAVRGNARAFGRLMSLRTAFNTQTDKRDRRRAEHPARHLPRRTAQELEVRRLGENLQFRNRSVSSPTSEHFAIQQSVSESISRPILDRLENRAPRDAKRSLPQMSQARRLA